MPCLLAAPPEHTNYHYANILDDLLRYGTLREVIDELNSPRWILPLGWSQAKEARGATPLSAVDSSTSTGANLLSAASTAPERHFAFRFACFCILLGRGANPLSEGSNGMTVSEVLAVRLKQDKDADRLRFVEELEVAVKYWKTGTGYQLPLDIVEWIEVEKEEPDFTLHQQDGVAGIQCHEGDFTMSPELENAEEGGHDQSSNDQKRLKLEDGELPDYVDQAPTPRPEPKEISPAAFRQVPAPPAAAPIAKAPSYSKRRVPPPPPPLQSATPTAKSRLPLSVHAPMRPATARLSLEPQTPIPPQPLPPTSTTPNGFALAPAVAPLPTSLLQTQAASLTAKSCLPPKPKETLPPAAPPAAGQSSDSRRWSTSTTPVPPRPGPSASLASQTPSSAAAAPPLAGLPRAVVLEDPVTQAMHNPTVRQEIEQDDVDMETDDGEDMELCRPSASPSPPPAASTLASGPAPAPSPSFAPTSTGAAESKAVSMVIDSSIDTPAREPTISPPSQLTANPAPSNTPTSAPIISTASSSAPPATTVRPTSSSASQPPPKKKSRLSNLFKIQAAKAARHASAQASSPSELPSGSGSGAAQAQERASVSQSPGLVAGQTVQGGTAVAGSVDEAESSQAGGIGQLERQDERMEIDLETEGEARSERGRTQRSSSTVSSSSTGGAASSGSRPSSRLPPNLPQPKSTSRLPPNLKLAATPAYPNKPSLGTALSTSSYVEKSLPPIAHADGRAPGLVNKDATSIALASGRTPSLPPKPSFRTASLPPTKPKSPTGLRINTTGSLPAKPQTHHSLRDSAVPRFPHNPITAAVHASSILSPGSTPSTVPHSGPSPRMTSSNAITSAARPTSTSTESATSTVSSARKLGRPLDAPTGPAAMRSAGTSPVAARQPPFSRLPAGVGQQQQPSQAQPSPAVPRATSQHRSTSSGPAAKPPARSASSSRSPTKPPAPRETTMELHRLPSWMTESLLRHYLLQGPTTFSHVKSGQLPCLDDLLEIDGLSNPPSPAAVGDSVGAGSGQDWPPPIPRSVELSGIMPQGTPVAEKGLVGKVTYTTRGDALRAKGMFDGEKVAKCEPGLGVQWMELQGDIDRWRAQQASSTRK
ncbi:hypothetical protein JCM11641_005461 [Rhodosporidiobolus odoratus]